jgi:hypothetical protein
MHDALIVTEFWFKKGMVLAASKLIIGRHNCDSLLKKTLVFFFGGGGQFIHLKIF